MNTKLTVEEKDDKDCAREEAAATRADRLDRRLDEALEETFPASDPPAVHRTD
jgi:hypothetical protein